MKVSQDDKRAKYPAHMWVVGAPAYKGLKKFEGWAARSYSDIGGNATIGWGHRVKAGTMAQITKEQGERLLKYDAMVALDCIRKHVTVRLADHQVDALVMLVFNIGCAAFAHSHLLIMINGGTEDQIEREWLNWDHVHGKKVAGLTKRRAYELDMWQGLPF